MVNRGEEKVRVHMNVVPRSIGCCRERGEAPPIHKLYVKGVVFRQNRADLGLA